MKLNGGPTCFINHTPADGIISFSARKVRLTVALLNMSCCLGLPVSMCVKISLAINSIASSYLGKIVQFLRVIRQGNFRHG